MSESMDEDTELMSLEEIERLANPNQSAYGWELNALFATARAAHKLKQHVEELEKAYKLLQHESDAQARMLSEMRDYEAI